MRVTRSLIGALAPDGFTYQARCCHNRGEPDYQIPQLATALHGFYRGDAAALAATILQRDWWMLAPDEAATETLTGTADNRLRPPQLKPVAGIGYYDIDFAQAELIEGVLAETPHPMYAWLYAFTADGTLVVLANDNSRRWAQRQHFTAEDLRNRQLRGHRYQDRTGP